MTESGSGLESEHYFNSIPSSMFPCLLMLTGEFPIGDFTTAGKWVAGAMAIIAVAFFAIPTAILGSAFIQVMEAEDTLAKFEKMMHMSLPHIHVHEKETPQEISADSLNITQSSAPQSAPASAPGPGSLKRRDSNVSFVVREH